MVQTTNTQSKGHPTGYDLLRNPRSNKGTAFTDAERRKYRLEGLLPPAATNIELQAARRHTEIANLGDDLQKYLVLSDLQRRNERLYWPERLQAVSPCLAR
jgi:malate dehydrogenase (oxaloacetate-decarboxylating)(NADP+)